jgi:hypothetical protein
MRAAGWDRFGLARFARGAGGRAGSRTDRSRVPQWLLPRAPRGRTVARQANSHPGSKHALPLQTIKAVGRLRTWGMVLPERASTKTREEVRKRWVQCGSCRQQVVQAGVRAAVVVAEPRPRPVGPTSDRRRVGALLRPGGTRARRPQVDIRVLWSSGPRAQRAAPLPQYRCRTRQITTGGLLASVRSASGPGDGARPRCRSRRGLPADRRCCLSEGGAILGRTAIAGSAG